MRAINVVIYSVVLIASSWLPLYAAEAVRCHSFDNVSDEFADLIKPNPAQSRLAFKNSDSSSNLDSQGLKKYRLAITTTGEFARFHGGTVDSTLVAVKEIVAQANEVFERDLGITLELVSGNARLIYTDPEQDPFVSGNTADIAVLNQKVVDSIIGSDNYDIAHVLGTSGGGLGYRSSICDNQHKAMGFSGISAPFGKRFALDFFAHELGHQLGADHTFNGTQGLCGGGQRNASSAVEPGSGSSIMSYAGFCSSDNVSLTAESLYHIHSIQQIKQTVWNGVGSQCGEVIPHYNQAPSLPLSQSYIIPTGTPFELSADDIVDLDGDDLQYAWQQMDAGDAAKLGQDKGNNALITPLAPSTDSVRSFPSLDSLFNGYNDPAVYLPQQNRYLNMMLTVYDGKNVASTEQSIRTFKSERAFVFTQVPNTIQAGNGYSLLWDTADTELPPVMCSEVDISLSVNNEVSFLPLASNIPNNGQANVTIPSHLTQTQQARFKLKCSDNIFFTLSPLAQSNSSTTTPASSSPSTVSISGNTAEDDMRVTVASVAANTEAGSMNIMLLLGLLLLVSIRYYRSRTITIACKVKL